MSAIQCPVPPAKRIHMLWEFRIAASGVTNAGKELKMSQLLLRLNYWLILKYYIEYK